MYLSRARERDFSSVFPDLLDLRSWGAAATKQRAATTLGARSIKPRKASDCLWGFNHVIALMHFKLTSRMLWRGGARAETHKAADQLPLYNWTGL